MSDNLIFFVCLVVSVIDIILYSIGIPDVLIISNTIMAATTLILLYNNKKSEK